jgi:RNA ligase (TIGR02306 family)
MTTPQPPILTQILSLDKHLNADTLQIAKVLGFQTVVKEGLYSVGSSVMYFEPDTAFTLETAQALGIDSYLSKKTDIYGNKVLVIKEVKLRGELSEGLLLPEYKLANYGSELNSFPCFKYEAPSTQTKCENAAAENVLFPQYGSLENLRKSPNFFIEGDQVVVTEKIHGTNSRVGFYTGEDGNLVLQAGSRTVNRTKPEPGTQGLYWKPFDLQPGLITLLESLFLARVKYATVYGEIYGPTIQSYSYGLVNKEIAYRAFTIKTDGKVMAPKAAHDLFAYYGVEAVPIIHEGPYTYELIQQLAERVTSCASKEFTQHLAEGVVVQHQDKIAKYVSTNFLLGKSGRNKTSDL